MLFDSEGHRVWFLEKELDMSRTDLHKPSSIVPANYEHVSYDYFGSTQGDLGMMMYLQGERQAYRAHKERTGGKSFERDSGGTCDCCGAHAAYVSRYYYVPGNEYVVIGHICASKMEIGDDMNFASFKKRIQAGLEGSREMSRAQKYLIERGMQDVIEFYKAAKEVDYTAQTWEQRTANDIVNSLKKYKSLSDKQIALLKRLPAGHAEKIAKQAQWEAERAAKNAAAAPLPATDTRMTIVGTIVTVKGQDGAYGFQWKMLVEHADGWKVWGSVPASVVDEVTQNSVAGGYEEIRADIVRKLKGRRVEFDAKVKVSDNDPKFGFFNRPTKASLIQAAVAA